MKPDKILLATANSGKVAEYKEYLADFSIQVLYLDDLPALPDPEETESTFQGNALLKARYYAAASGMPVLADDSGISITALDGFPGIYAKRYAEEFGGYQQTFQDLENRLHAKMKDAEMVCAIAYYDASSYAQEEPVSFCEEARVLGELIFDPARIQTPGFGYDPIFQPKGHADTFAENKALKAKISHRKQALTKMMAALENLWGEQL